MRTPVHYQDCLSERQASVVLDLLIDTDSVLHGIAKDAGIVIVDDEANPNCDDESQKAR